ncbi:MAG: hypothetical protein U5K69_24690 [Balneolaceae bacterium]|nr:hypothetical protein [Balneolaceae bacterium]
MEKSDSGNLIFWGAALMVIPLWLMSFPETTVRHNMNPFLVYSSQLTAINGFSLFALTFVLSARWKWLEDYFWRIGQDVSPASYYGPYGSGFVADSSNPAGHAVYTR